MRTIASSLFIVLFCFSAKCQFYERKNRPLMDLNGNYSMNGWILSPGLTYMWPNKITWLGGQKKEDTVARGRIGLYLEIGRYHIFPEGGAFFNYMDYSIAYKRLSGSEEISDLKSKFKKNYVSGNFNINNIYQLGDRHFLQNSIGINIDYQLWENGTPSPVNTKKLLFCIHYRIGYGIKLTEKLFVIPTLETPIINLRQWEKGKSTYGIFNNSRYRPIVFSCRFAWLKSPSRANCPPVYVNPGDKAKQDQHFME